MANIANTLNPNLMMPDLGTAPIPNVQLGMSLMPSAAESLPQLPDVHPMVRTLTPQERDIDTQQQQLQHMRTQDAGTPWNQRSTGSKIAHVLNVAGQTAGNIFAPGIMARVPGTELNRDVHENELEGQLGEERQSLSQNNERDATTQATQLANAAEPEKAKLGNELTQSTIAKNDEEAQPKPVDLSHAYGVAVQRAINAGRDPHTDPVVQQLEDAIVGVQPGQNKPDAAPKTIQIEQGGKPHQMGWDPKTSKYDIDEGESGEKPPTVNVNEGHKEQLQQKQQVFKTYQPVMDSAERMNVMTKNYEDAAKTHNQQAMLSLLYNHMGMTMGLQKGARMTQQLINEAQQSQPWLQGLRAKFDKDGVLTGVTLSPQQMRDMVSLAQDRYKEDVGKARNEAGYLGASDDGPARTPGAATINYYVHMAGGDANKAKQLAAQDGWTVK